jgi:hypothetical protein
VREQLASLLEREAPEIAAMLRATSAAVSVNARAHDRRAPAT